jgi:hypothetical protein
MDANVPVEASQTGDRVTHCRANREGPDKGETLGKYEFPRVSTNRTEVLIDALTEVSAYGYL